MATKKKAVSRTSKARKKKTTRRSTSTGTATRTRTRTAGTTRKVASRTSSRTAVSTKESAKKSPASPPPLKTFASKGRPSPFVVARGEDPLRVFDEALKHTGFFEHIESKLAKSGKRRETFEIVCKVDFLRGMRKEENPVSYVDPKLVRHLCNRLLDSGFRLLRVVDTCNEFSRYCLNRSAKQVGRALGYDESCYELRDLAQDLVPFDYGDVGQRAAGKYWLTADYRICFAKNGTHEVFGPSLLFFSLLGTLAIPSLLLALQQGLDPAAFVFASLRENPVDFGLIDAIHTADGPPAYSNVYELLRSEDGEQPEGPAILQTNTILAGQDLAAVECAGHKLQGLDPLDDKWFFPPLRRSTGFSPPEEIAGLTAFPGWCSYGRRIREAIDMDKPVEAFKVGMWLALQRVDPHLFPPQPGGFQYTRLRRDVEKYLGEARKRVGVVEQAAESAE